MKLIELYIENFGGLSRYSLEFQDGMTVIEEPNGFGKTTLAEFIRAMFYGFPRKAKTLDKSRRQKYTPWSGGKCGGYLVFELEGKQYRIERTFGATPKSDTYTLIDLSTNKKSNRFSEEIGLELFQLDGDSFERSTYMPQMGDTAVMTTDSIRSKLSNLVEDTNDVGNFEKAMAVLKAKRSTYVPYRGSGGSVMQAHSRVSQIQGELMEAEGRRVSLEAAEQNIRNLELQSDATAQALEQVREEIRLASEAAVVAAVHRQKARIRGQWEQTRDSCIRLEEQYPGGVPSPESIEQARQAASELESFKKHTVTDPEDLEAEAFLEENRGRFAGKIPTNEELTQCRNWCGQLSQLRSRTVELAASAGRSPDVKANPLPLVLLLLATVGEIALGLSMMGEMLGYIALGIGAVALIGSVFAAVRLAAARKQMRQISREQELAAREMKRLSGETEALTARIRNFLGVYGSVEGKDFYDLLADLEHDAEDYLRAEKRVTVWKQDQKRHEEMLEGYSSQLDGFFAEYALIPQPDVRMQLLQIRDDRKDWEEAVREAEALQQELEAFRQANRSLLEKPLQETAADPESLRWTERELTGEQEGITAQLLRQRQKREMLEDSVHQIPELRDELAMWQEKRTEDQKKSDLLDDTMAMLTQAKENLSGNYMGPIRRSFEGYLDKLWGEAYGQALVTEDLDVQLERYGQARELGYFSAGQTDLVLLGMRFALVDALFAGEKPIVILDDPFVNLDDQRMKQALNLLEELAQDRQILYLTCSSSRTPK